MSSEKSTRWPGSLFRPGRRQPERRMTHKTNDPRYVVDANLRMQLLKRQSGLRSPEKPLRFRIDHEPLAALLLPPHTRPYFASKIDENRVPDKSNGWHTVAPSSDRLRFLRREAITVQYHRADYPPHLRLPAGQSVERLVTWSLVGILSAIVPSHGRLQLLAIRPKPLLIGRH